MSSILPVIRLVHGQELLDMRMLAFLQFRHWSEIDRFAFVKEHH